MSKFDLLIESDPDFHKGTGEFIFPNGDKYAGNYYAHRSGIVWREGTGKYTTADGHVYVGEWREDKLIEGKLVEVTYKDGVQFHGYLTKNKYEGTGMYIFDHKMVLLCDFSNNKPVGDMTVIDIKGREWHGVAGQDEVLLLPDHIYFNNINDSSGKGRRRYTAKQRKRHSDVSFRSRNLYMAAKSKPKSITQITQRSRSLISQSLKPIEQPPLKVTPPRKQSLLRDEQKIFAKTKKTASELQFEKSDWYKDYTNFKDVYDNIKHKIDESGEDSLNEGEKHWYHKYLNFKRRYWEIINSRRYKDKQISKEEFFQLLSCKEFESKCPPVQVVYASTDCESACNEEVVNEEETVSGKT